MKDEDFIALSPADAYEHALRQPGDQRVRLFKVYQQANGVEAQRDLTAIPPKPAPMTDPGPVRCPKCYSAQVYAGPGPWAFITGLWGIGDVILTCLKCGQKFAPGKGA